MAVERVTIHCLGRSGTGKCKQGARSCIFIHGRGKALAASASLSLSLSLLSHTNTHTHTRISSVSLGCCETGQRPKSCFPRIVAMAGLMITKNCWWSGGEYLLISRLVRWGLEESWLQKHPLRTAVPDETNARRIRRIGQGGQSSRWWNQRVEPVLHSHLFGHGH